jgi:pyruvate formate lyase activating enzyme
VRENREGKLYALNYGKAVAVHIDPIEKKPFFHFLPGTYSLSIATVGCNFKCASCQNWDISQMPQLTGRIEGRDITPEEIVKTALKNKLPSISYTYTEPAIFSEYTLDTMKLAKKEGLKNNWVTNGFWSKELFDLISPYLDAANVDLKGFTDDFYIKYCGGKLQPVLDTLKRLKSRKIWTEVTTLVIPTLNDSEKVFRAIANFIKNNLGPETPWHISQFSGLISWKLQDLPETPVETLEKAYKIGKEIGLKYVYTGNVPGLPSEDTFCPKCNTLVIDRTGYVISRHDKAGKCPKCKTDLNLIL